MTTPDIDKLLSRLDRLKNKKSRFESHQWYFTKCLEEDQIPNGLKIFVEPTIGNHDEEFVRAWYDIQSRCSRQLADLTKTFCDRVVIETTKEVMDVALNLQRKLPHDKYMVIKQEIDQRDELTKKQLSLKKTRKFHELKYGKPIVNESSRLRRSVSFSTQSVEQRRDEVATYRPTTKKHSYASVVKGMKVDSNEDLIVECATVEQHTPTKENQVPKGIDSSKIDIKAKTGQQVIPPRTEEAQDEKLQMERDITKAKTDVVDASDGHETHPVKIDLLGEIEKVILTTGNLKERFTRLLDPCCADLKRADPKVEHVHR